MLQLADGLEPQEDMEPGTSPRGFGSPLQRPMDILVTATQVSFSLPALPLESAESLYPGQRGQPETLGVNAHGTLLRGPPQQGQ
jgi:hypothetical protein